MFRFFRKHRWLLTIAMALVAFSFVVFMGTPNRNGNGGSASDLGTIYGHKVTPQDVNRVKNDVHLFYWFRNGDWPRMTEDQMETAVYERLLLGLKADKLGIHVSNESAAAQANVLMHSVARERITFDDFKTRILPSAGLTEADFVQFVRDTVAIDQLIKTLGVTGELLTPQEATDMYQRYHQETSAEMVYFSASNYLSQITVASNAVAEFYTNYMAAYRLPDRVQVSYVAFEITNFFAAAEQKLGKTNIDQQVDARYRQIGLEGVPGAKTLEEAKAKIREAILLQAGAALARVAANDFATVVFGKTPARADKLAAVAKDKNLPVHSTQPFSSQYGPEEFMAPESFVKASFALTPDEPFAGPVEGTEAYYVIALDKQLPSEIPSFSEIRDRVTRDYRMVNATTRAQGAGTNAFYQLQVQLAAGKSFSAACSAAGVHPVSLSPFSLTSGEIPQLGNHQNVSDEVKRTAFNLMPGQASNFVETEDGGFIVFVNKRTPVDTATMKEALPEFMTQLRGSRANEFFNIWLYTEKNRELQKTPLFRHQAGQQNKS